MNAILLLDLVGVAFLVASAFNANFRRTNSMGIGLSLIAIGHLILPSVA
jgi:hypothetical protein